MGFGIPELIQAVSVLLVAVFTSYVLIKLSKLLDQFSDKLERERKEESDSS
ncbi:MAG: hypothetical protein K9J79_08235 [Desulfobacteraceae bacterium]|nr:hypothetical protein [Desulfobacteraceae bacterium]